MSRSRLVRRLAAALLAGALAGCGPTGPTPSATLDPGGSPPPPAEIYAGIRAQVEAIRGLRPTAAVEPVTIGVDELARNLAAAFDARYVPGELAETEAILITMGLLPEGSSIRALTLDFQAGQVAGYYDSNEDALFVVDRDGGLGAADRVTYAHEYTHQLQDQNIGLESLGLEVEDEDDRSLARIALVEGDAVSVQTDWTLANLNSEELGELIASALTPAALEALQRAPAYLRDTTIFEYQDGAAFVARLIAEGGYAAVNAAYADPPASTEQILHPDVYLKREAPVDVEVPASVAGELGAGWSVAQSDTLGELLLRIWLREGGIPLAEARSASAGWGGDRLVLLGGPNDDVAVGLVTTWDSAADAAEFSAAAATAVQARGAGGLVLSDGLLRVYVAMGDRPADVIAALAG